MFVIFSLINSGLGSRSLQYLMFYLCRRCVGSARLQLRLFDLLSLEDVQYLSAQFPPIIPPMDRFNSFPTSQSGNYHGFLTARVCYGNDTATLLKRSFSVREECQRSWERLTRWLLYYVKVAFTSFRVQSTFWIACNERENSKTAQANVAISLSSIPKNVIRLFELVSNISSAVSHTVPLCIHWYLIHIFLYLNEICAGHKFIFLISYDITHLEQSDWEL